MSIDINGEITVGEIAKPATITSTATSAGVDITSFEGKLKCTLNVGAVSGTSPVNTAKLQDSADDSTYADISGATYSAVSAANSIESIAVDTRSTDKYIRAVQTLTGTSPSFASALYYAGQKKVR